MKKITAIIITAIIACLTLLSFSGCALIFNDGSEDEVEGVYGLQQLYLKDYDNETYNFGNKYDYYLIVLYGDKTGKVILKPEDGEETSYSVTYENVLDTDGKTVKQIKINGFLVPVFSIEDGVAKVEFVKSEEAADFAFAPKREVLTYKNVFTRIENGIKTKKYYLSVDKIYNRTTDRKVERAKKQQINNRDKRAGNGEDE